MRGVTSRSWRAPLPAIRGNRGSLGLVLLVVCCGLLFGTASGASAALIPRGALLQAETRVHRITNLPSPSSVHESATDALGELVRATAPALWINSREAVAPSYGTRVFQASIAALTDLRPLTRLSIPAARAASELIVAADRGLAKGVITQARGGDQRSLASARQELSAGGRAAGAGRRASAARSYAKAWKDAFNALTQLASAAATGVPSAVLAAAAEEALGSKLIGLAGPMIQEGQPPLTAAGKPELLFAGAEGCPFCAVQRWGMIVALSQFGTFSNLHLMQSDTTNPPAVRTFTFFGASYQSPYISFVPVEVLSNVRRGFGFAHLQQLTTAEGALVQRFDPPGQTPFIDIANRFTGFDSTVQPGLLSAMSWRQIASSLTHPASIPAQAISGVAEVLTAELCQATNGNPQSVCGTQVVRQYEAALPFLDGKGGGCPTTHMIAASARRQGPPPPMAQATRCHT
jgi:Domain of unknown function (DUF929)